MNYSRPPLKACSIENCPKKVEARGWCPMHYQRWRTTGDPIKTKTRQTIVRIEGKQGYVSVAGGTWAKCDASDLPLLSKHLWNRDQDGYIRTQIEGKNITMHQLLVGRGADHINRVPADNRRSNLRKCTSKQNSYNRGPCSNNRLGLKGVYFHPGRNRFRAHIRIDGRRFDLGEFRTAEEAARAYDYRAKKEWGEFAFNNFPVAA